jgi:cystathionine gamma-synthase
MIGRLPGIESEAVDLDDGAEVVRLLRRGPAALWAESPSNPLLRVHDIRRLAQVAADTGALLVVDNTTATPILQQPLDLGAAASVYSLTKAASGHSDVVLGAVVTRSDDLATRLRGWRTAAGGIPGPFEAWLALRGLRTLALRVKRESENALAVARYLAGHASVREVHYPGLDGPALEVAAMQMHGGFGPMLSFEVAGDGDAADRVVAAAGLIRPGTSFGGVESSWERRARWPSETASPSLIRLSCGIEAIADLLADIEQALAHAAGD